MNVIIEETAADRVETAQLSHSLDSTEVVARAQDKSRKSSEPGSDADAADAARRLLATDREGWLRCRFAPEDPDDDRAAAGGFGFRRFGGI